MISVVLGALLFLVVGYTICRVARGKCLHKWKTVTSERTDNHLFIKKFEVQRCERCGEERGRIFKLNGKEETVSPFSWLRT